MREQSLTGIMYNIVHILDNSERKRMIRVALYLVGKPSYSIVKPPEEQLVHVRVLNKHKSTHYYLFILLNLRALVWIRIGKFSLKTCIKREKKYLLLTHFPTTPEEHAPTSKRLLLLLQVIFGCIMCKKSSLDLMQTFSRSRSLFSPCSLALKVDRNGSRSEYKGIIVRKCSGKSEREIVGAQSSNWEQTVFFFGGRADSRERAIYTTIQLAGVISEQLARASSV